MLSWELVPFEKLQVLNVLTEEKTLIIIIIIIIIVIIIIIIIIIIVKLCSNTNCLFSLKLILKLKVRP